jgi:hypothetical protein
MPVCSQLYGTVNARRSGGGCGSNDDDRMPANGDNDKEIIVVVVVVVVVVVAAVAFDSAGRIHGSPRNSAGGAVPGRWTDSGICGVVVGALL